jgi:hypothetical protein
MKKLLLCEFALVAGSVVSVASVTEDYETGET